MKIKGLVCPIFVNLCHILCPVCAYAAGRDTIEQQQELVVPSCHPIPNTNIVRLSRTYRTMCGPHCVVIPLSQRTCATDARTLRQRGTTRLCFTFPRRGNTKCEALVFQKEYTNERVVPPSLAAYASVLRMYAPVRTHCTHKCVRSVRTSAYATHKCVHTGTYTTYAPVRTLRTSACAAPVCALRAHECATYTQVRNVRTGTYGAYTQVRADLCAAYARIRRTLAYAPDAQVCSLREHVCATCVYTSVRRMYAHDAHKSARTSMCAYVVTQNEDDRAASCAQNVVRIEDQRS